MVVLMAKTSKNIPLNVMSLHGYITKSYKQMYGKGAEEVKVSIKDNLLEVSIKMSLNHIEEQLWSIPEGKEIVLLSRKMIFEKHLQSNMDNIRDILNKETKIINRVIDLDQKLTVFSLSI